MPDCRNAMSMLSSADPPLKAPAASHPSHPWRRTSSRALCEHHGSWQRGVSRGLNSPRRLCRETQNCVLRVCVSIYSYERCGGRERDEKRHRAKKREGARTWRRREMARGSLSVTRSSSATAPARNAHATHTACTTPPGRAPCARGQRRARPAAQRRGFGRRGGYVWYITVGHFKVSRGASAQWVRVCVSSFIIG